MRRLTLALLLLGAASPARAFLRPAGAPAALTLETPSTSMLVVHRAGREDLVISPQYRASAPPAELAWIIPLPARADWFGRVEGDPFADLVTLSGAAAEPGPPIVPAAPYAIQQLGGRGPDAVAAVVRWLRDGGFAPVEEARLRRCAERGWTFLAVLVTPRGGATSLPRAGRLPPLHITFPSDRGVYPLEAEESPAAMRLWWIGAEPLAEQLRWSAADRGFQPGALPRATLRAADAPSALGGVLREAGAWTAQGEMHVVSLQTAGFGVGRADPEHWPDELGGPRPVTSPRPPSVATGTPEPHPAAHTTRRADPPRPGCQCRTSSATERRTWLPACLVLAIILTSRRRRHD